MMNDIYSGSEFYFIIFPIFTNNKTKMISAGII